LTGIYQIRLAFEWGGGCLWCGNESARNQFDVGPVEDVLPLSDATRASLVEMTAWHDKALDWDYPQGPSPWSRDEFKRFELAAQSIQRQIQSELGAEFEVTYQPLG
jgi:hypothetical protein